ncbi:MAG: sulfatase-like hydrolase/transferase [Holosporales bacterium]|jgi:glucan phosphoethanolaminetransferase (alkaline phosphatase superfamily)|nr:sulfatase-like hydrolase/transferase [Holosporales bacterium]
MSNFSGRDILAAFVVAFLLVLPDWVFACISQSFKAPCDIKVLLLVLPLSAGFIMSRYRIASYICLVILWIMQLMQFSNLAYFGHLLSPYSLYLFSSEISDVLQEASNVFVRYLYIIPIVTIPFFAIAYLTKRSKTRCWIGSVMLVCSFCAFGYKYYDSIRPRFNPNGIRFTIDNSLKAFWGYLTIKYKRYPVKNYKPYEVVSIDGFKLTEPVTVVYIIGESTNFRHMSLFGYERKTTPLLEELSKDNGFYYTHGIAGAISTIASCKFMMNVLREADNAIQASKDTTNLFKLAKSRGFKTFYLSMQTEHMLSSIAGVNYIDVVRTKDSNIIKVNELMDEYLFDLINQQEFGEFNFIILHQRCIHTPYTNASKRNHKKFKKFDGSKEPVIDDYDNAMVYNDMIISALFNRFNGQKNGKFYVIWASDHNELMGEDGLFGHGHGCLHFRTAEIPIMVQSNDAEFIEKIKMINRPTHYEIARCIASLFGYNVRNPNEEENVFFISGVDFNGRCGFLRYEKDSDSRNG